MRKIKLLAIAPILLLIFSCDENRIYEMHESAFPDYRWEKNNVIEFNPEVPDTEQEYKIYIALRHVYGFQLKKVKVSVEMIFPDGKTKTKSYKLKVMKWKG